MKTKQVWVLLLLGIFAGFASAGNTGSYNVTLDIGNTGPTVDDVYMASGNSSATPIQASSVTVYGQFDASDPNGNADLDTATAECHLSGAMTSGACSKTVIDSDSATYTCPISISFYTAAGSYSLHCSIADMGASSANKEEAAQFTYNTLLGISIAPSSLLFTGLSVGQTTGASNDPITVTNEGNVQVNNVSINSQDLENIATDVLGASNFNATATDAAGSGQPMVAGEYVEVVGVTVPVGAAQADDVFFWVQIPAIQPGGSYTSTSNWVLLAQA